MKNIILLLISLTIFLSACNKCLTCNYKDSKNQTVRLQEACGNKKLLDDYEKKCNENAKIFNTTCSCENQ